MKFILATAVATAVATLLSSWILDRIQFRTKLRTRIPFLEEERNPPLRDNLEVANCGRLPVTLMKIELRYYEVEWPKVWLWKFRHPFKRTIFESRRVIENLNLQQRLPYKLEPGDVWTGYFENVSTNIAIMADVCYAIYHSHSKYPKRQKISRKRYFRQ